MRRLITIMALVTIVAVCLVLLANRGSSVLLTVEYKNASGVEIYETSSDENHETNENIAPVASISVSGERVHVKKNQSYVAVYKGLSGYASGEQVFSVKDIDLKVMIDPDYSDEKMKSLLATEKPAIDIALQKEYPNISLYTIEPGKLYKHGMWYGTTLVYVGPQTPNKDSLRAVLQKVNGSWVVKTDPPFISLSKYTYPDVPVDILDDVNRMPVPEIKNPQSTGTQIRI